LKLLPRARRSSGGFRLFTVEHIERVQFIKQAQELGLSLEEVKNLRCATELTPLRWSIVKN
jgi:DNA-binding transcriptional MerR regulator